MTYPHNGILFDKKKSAKCAIKCDILIHERSYKKKESRITWPCLYKESRGVNLERQEVDLCLDTFERTGGRE